MPSRCPIDRSALCTVTFSDGRQCRLPRSPGHSALCTTHARMEAPSLASEQTGEDIARLISGVAQGHVKPSPPLSISYILSRFGCRTNARSSPVQPQETLMSISRRELCALLPALAVPAVLRSEAAADVPVLPSAMYPFDRMTPRPSSAATIRDVLKGKLVTGESLEVHQTTLPPAAMPHPPHRHAHSEMWLIREGTVELTVEGNSTQMGPGSVGFVRSNDEHGIRNVGATPATYFVVAIGPSSVGG